MRFNVAVALITLVVGLGIVAAGDRTAWSQGFGWDGRTYGDLAQHFPGAVFGDEGVTPPGYGPYSGPRPHGVDPYYVRRILPSAVVYFTLSGLGIDKTHDSVVTCFGVWNAAVIALVAFLWCLIADRLGLRRSAKLLGLSALLVNFAVLKSAFYWPVGTDTFAFGFGAASLYFWLSRNTLGLVATTVLGSFVWPTQLPFGALLLLFPPGRAALIGSALSMKGDRRRSTAFRVSVAAAPALALLGYLIYLRIDGYSSFIPLGGAFPLAVLAAAAFAFFGLLWLLPDLAGDQLKRMGRSLLSPRLALVAVLAASVLVSQALIATQPAIINEWALLKTSLWFSALNPGLFAVAIVGYFGPLFVLAALRWPQICDRFHSYGLGATLAAVLFLATCLFTEPRKLIVLYPFFVLFAVLGTQELAERRWFVPGFFIGSLALSRVWLPIGHFGFASQTSLLHFPAQRYYMSTGVWTSFHMYLAHLAVAAMLVVLFLAFLRRPAAPPVHKGESLRAPA